MEDTGEMIPAGVLRAPKYVNKPWHEKVFLTTQHNSRSQLILYFTGYSRHASAATDFTL